MSIKNILSIAVGACMIGTATVTAAAGTASLASGIKDLRNEMKKPEEDDEMEVDPQPELDEVDDDPEAVPGADEETVTPIAE